MISFWIFAACFSLHHYCSCWQAFGTIVIAINERNSKWRAANADWFYVLISTLIQLRHPVQSLRLLGVFIATWIIYTFPPFALFPFSRLCNKCHPCNIRVKSGHDSRMIPPNWSLPSSSILSNFINVETFKISE